MGYVYEESRVNTRLSIKLYLNLKLNQSNEFKSDQIYEKKILIQIILTILCNRWLS